MWYVIQTRTGKEQELVDLIKKMLPVELYCDCFFFKRQLLKRLGGQWLEVTETLFPAYVVLDTEQPENVFYELKKIPEFSKLLGDNGGVYIPLEKEEKEFLQKLTCGNEKYLVQDTTLYMNADGRVLRMEGPLIYFQDRILKLNLRKRYALVEFTIHGNTETAMLGIRLEKDRA